MEAFVHDALQDMRIARSQLDETLDALDDADWDRYVPYGARTVRDVLAHLAGADRVWALAAQGILRGESEIPAPPTPAEADAARARMIDRGRGQSIAELRGEMDRRRRLLTGLYGLLEKKHLARRLPGFEEPHNSVRERIWLGYHDRLHRDDIARALRMQWHPQALEFLPEVVPVVEALQPGATMYVIYSVDPAYWERPTAGLAWTYRQLLAHIATGDWVLQHHLRHIVETGRVADWPDVDAGNDERVSERRLTTDRALTDEFLSTRHETMRLLAALKRVHLDLPIEFRWEPRPNSHTVLEYLQMFHRHDRTHREQLRPAMKHNTSTRA